MSFTTESVLFYGLNVDLLDGFPSAIDEDTAEIWSAFVRAHAVELGMSAREVDDLVDAEDLENFFDGYEYGCQGCAAVFARVLDALLDGAPDGTVYACECDACCYVGIGAPSLFPWEAAEYASRFPKNLKEMFDARCRDLLGELGLDGASAIISDWSDTITG